MNDEDLTNQESRMIYDSVEFGEELPMTKKRPIDIDWTDHAEYRGELRDIDPHQMNEAVTEKVRGRFLKKPKSKGKEKFKSESGTAVVDFDTSENPAQADVVTTWASETGEVAMLKFASAEEAIQHLANITGKRVKVAALGKHFDIHAGIRSPKEIESDFAHEDYPAIAGAYRGNYETLYTEYMHMIEKAKKMEEYLDELYKHPEFRTLDVEAFKG